MGESVSGLLYLEMVLRIFTCCLGAVRGLLMLFVVCYYTSRGAWDQNAFGEVTSVPSGAFCSRDRFALRPA